MPTLAESDKTNKPMEPIYIILGDPHAYLNSHKLIYLANDWIGEDHTHTQVRTMV